MKLFKRIFAVVVVVSLMLTTMIGINVKHVEGLEVKHVGKHKKHHLEVEVTDKNENLYSKHFEKDEGDLPTDRQPKNVDEQSCDTSEQDEAIEENKQDVNTETNTQENIEEVKEEEPVVELTIEQKIQNTCSAYGIDYSIALAIARLETGWFTSDAYLYRNNPGGLSRNEVPIYFASKDEGVDYFVRNLANNYFNIGLNTPEKIAGKYCPPASYSWASKVRSLMNYGG